MFDQHHYHRHDTTHRTTITEQRAPTDESVRILRDMEDRAEKKVLAAVRVENTPVDMVIHKQMDVLNRAYQYACIFKINGKQMRADFIDKSSDRNRATIAVGIRDAVAKQIANVITAEAMQAAFNHFDFDY